MKGISSSPLRPFLFSITIYSLFNFLNSVSCLFPFRVSTLFSHCNNSEVIPWFLVRKRSAATFRRSHWQFAASSGQHSGNIISTKTTSKKGNSIALLLQAKFTSERPLIFCEVSASFCWWRASSDLCKRSPRPLVLVL